MKNPLTSENEMLVAAIPSASVTTMTRLFAGVFACWRSANVRSVRRWSSHILPVLDEMVRRPPRERLGSERRIVRAARAHHRRAEHTEIRRVVREAPAIDDVGVGVVAHARA